MNKKTLNSNSSYNKQIGGSHYQGMSIQPSQFVIENKMLFFLNRFELDIMVMKDLSPGGLQLQESLARTPQLLRQIIQDDVSKYGWQQYATTYMIDSGFGGGENYAYELTSLYNDLQIAGLSWMELQIGYHALDAIQIVNELAEKINIPKEDANAFADNINSEPFHFTKQFLKSYLKIITKYDVSVLSVSSQF